MPNLVYTIGHSTRPLEELTDLLRQFGVAELVDVRHFPGSRHNPQFNLENLREQLPAAGLLYSHQPELGGHRPHKPNSINLAWQNEAFRAYADYMATPEFAAGMEALLAKARARQACIMCAEVLPWRCHRRLIADALLVEGFEVQHILDARSVRPHVLTPWARVVEGRLIYPAERVS